MALELKGVTRVVRGQTHLHETNLRLDRGTMNVLLGPTLSGKTSLMRVMAGLDRPTTGQILWNAEDVTATRVQDRGVAMVYQQFINYPAMSVFDNIASPLRLAGKSSGDIDKAVRKTADLLRLTPLLDRRPLELSGGQQQRCALARALVKGAGLVLLDEPLANLDFKLREELRVEIPRIFEESGAIFVYATTEPEEALLLGGNTATLWEGRITQFGPTSLVYRRPSDAQTARVFSDPPMNFVSCRKAGNSLSFDGASAVPAIGAQRMVADGDYLAGFRANHVVLDHQEAGVRFICTVESVEITGSETFLHLRPQAGRWVGLLGGVHDVAAQSEIVVQVDQRFVYLFDAQGRIAADAPYAAAS